jgi:hypothetical protein
MYYKRSKESIEYLLLDNHLFVGPSQRVGNSTLPKAVVTSPTDSRTVRKQKIDSQTLRI